MGDEEKEIVTTYQGELSEEDLETLDVGNTEDEVHIVTPAKDTTQSFEERAL